MAFLLTVIYWEGLLLFGGFAILIAGQLLGGGINTTGMLHGQKGDGASYLSPERVQLLLFTLGAAFQYVAAVLHDPTSFPVVQQSWLAVLGASHVVYLGGKMGASFIGRQGKSL